MSRRILRSSLLIVFLIAVAVTSAVAGLGSNKWYEFSFTQVMVPAQGCYPADPNGLDCVPSSGTKTYFAPAPPWTFTIVPAGGVLTVTDAFLYGDSFEVFDGGVSIGMTPNVPTGGGCGSDPVVCLMDPKSSHAEFTLAAGMHSITIEPLVIADAGAGYFMVTGIVPEPSTWLLLLSGTGAMAGALRRIRG